MLNHSNWRRRWPRPGNLDGKLNRCCRRVRLQAAGISLTLVREPTYVPFEPTGAEWTVAVRWPNRNSPIRPRSLAPGAASQVWPGSTLMYCRGKRYDGEVNPRFGSCG